MNARILDVYWNNDLTGQLAQSAAGTLSFTYHADFLHRAATGISLSLPLREAPFEGEEVRAFFSGLLPEESVRTRLAAYLGVSEKNTFALLREVGGECAGALALYPEGEQPTAAPTDDMEVLDDARLSEILALIKRRPMLAGDDGYRLSLAGAQDKLAVGFVDGKIVLLKGGQPTTHILKPIIDRVADSAHNELFCMRLAKQVGLDVPVADIHFVNDTPYYLVERYDRTTQADGTVTRIHQEDFCQAMGVLPELKYEREGGPSIARCQNILALHAARPAADQTRLLEMVIFNYLIGNADAHGKNFSLLYRGAKPELAPAYDLLSTAIYPDLADKMAMKIGSKYKPDEVFLRHWHRLVPDTKTAQTSLNRQLKTMTTKTVAEALSLKQALEAQDIRSPVFTDIYNIIEARGGRILAQLGTQS
ncbi:MAG: type II toxin-antitoxin system HipA family toxin [Azospirillum brasilense]|nr:MAG: type II toxin-antitoxin system HipA family toxin [Azospirillum brasilense]